MPVTVLEWGRVLIITNTGRENVYVGTLESVTPQNGLIIPPHEKLVIPKCENFAIMDLEDALPSN